MMTLPPDVDRCLHKHTRYILDHMAPDGVYVYLSGAKIVEEQDKHQFAWAHDRHGKNHALLTIVARRGVKGFEAFLEALETTRQLDIVQRIQATLQENTNEASSVESIRKISNAGEIRSTAAPEDPVTSWPMTSSEVYIVGPQAAAGSPAFSARHNRSLKTPQTPPLTEAELDDHLNRLKGLLRKISTTHSDRHCRREAQDLLGELGDAGEAMKDRLTQLAEENVEKERELRRAKFMVRGMEAEIERMKNDPGTSASLPRVDSSSADSSDGAEKNGNRPQKSKLCAVL